VQVANLGATLSKYLVSAPFITELSLVLKDKRTAFLSQSFTTHSPLIFSAILALPESKRPIASSTAAQNSGGQDLGEISVLFSKAA
jgi:hypothetical protein